MTLSRALAPPKAARTGTAVLLHGYGADERDLLPLAAELDPGLFAISLRAPLAMPFGGRAWFSLEQTGDGFAFDAREVRRAAKSVSAELAAIAQEHGGPPLVIGFSQGAGVGLLCALERPASVRAVLSFSGVPPEPALFAPQAPAPPDTRLAEGLPVFAAHGRFDPLLPLEIGRRTRELLTAAGCALTWREYPIGHEICSEELADARNWLRGLPPWPRAGG
jgi:phospholipase/carboxylesterase